MRPKSLFMALGFSGFVALSFAQGGSIELIVKQKTEEGVWTDLGKAVVSQKLLTQGGKSVEVRLENGDLTTRQQSIYDIKGQMIRRYVQSLEKGRPKDSKIVTFDAKGANVVIDRSGTRETRNVPFLKDVPIANPSEFWFIREKPKAGQTVTWQQFTEADVWTTAKAVYKGRVPLPGKNVQAELVVTEYNNRKVESFFDDKGQILLVRDSIGIQMERQ